MRLPKVRSALRPGSSRREPTLSRQTKPVFQSDRLVAETDTISLLVRGPSAKQRFLILDAAAGG